MDNDSKLIKTTSVIGIPHLSYVSHTIQIIINRAINENSVVKDLWLKAKSFANFFSRGDKVYRKLIQKAKKVEIKIPVCTEIH